MAKVIAIANQKGGVGKTTTSINLSASLANFGQRVLLVDCDSQGNATSGLGLNRSTITQSVYNVLVDGLNPRYTLQMTPYGVTVLPASINLAAVEVELANLKFRETRLRAALDSLRNEYDYIIIDCPPALGLLTINAMTAVDAVIIPMQCEFYALEGLAQLLKTIEIIKNDLNPLLFIEGIVMTMFDGRTKHNKDVVDEVRATLGNLVYETIIPRAVKISEAASYGVPLLFYDKYSRPAKSYLNLAKEVINRGK